MCQVAHGLIAAAVVPPLPQWIEVILVGGAEFYRNGETDTEKRVYPGEG
jgi:hypothetical protein